MKLQSASSDSYPAKNDHKKTYNPDALVKLGLVPLIISLRLLIYTDGAAEKLDRIPADFRTGEQAMESVIAKLLQDFEQGKMNRRQLIQSLSVAAAAAAGMAPAAQAAGKPLEALYVNHISYQVNDYKKVRDFYVDLLGMKITEDDGKQCRLVFGNNILIPRNRAGGGPAKVDHISYTITNWDAEKDGLEEELKRRGLQYRGSAKTSFHVKDPEGMDVQFGGLHQ